MKVKFGMFITDGAGKVGGHVVQSNHYGRFVRTLVVPANPQTAFQQDRRAQHEFLTQNWRALTEPERTDWTTDSLNYPRTDSLGNIYYLSGINHYISLNLNLWMIGEAFITSPDTKRIPADPGSFTLIVDISSTRFRLTFAAAPDDTDSKVVVFATDGLSQGINYVSTKYRTIGIITPDAATTVFDLGAAYFATFPSSANGMKAFCKIVPIDEKSGCPGISRSTFATVTT